MKRMELIFLAMGLFLFTQVAQADWTPARRLTWSSVDSCLPRVFVDNSGKVHLVWYEGSPEYPDYGMVRFTTGRARMGEPVGQQTK